MNEIESDVEKTPEEILEKRFYVLCPKEHRAEMAADCRREHRSPPDMVKHMIAVYFERKKIEEIRRKHDEIAEREIKATTSQPAGSANVRRFETIIGQEQSLKDSQL